MPEVSVIMATYNCEKTVAKSIESIVNQSLRDWELIICDDGSTDNTYPILESYRDRDERIVLLRNQKNAKLAYALNRCLKLARGRYIARMDGDDESFPQRLEKQAAFLDAHPEYAVVGTAMVPFDDRGDRPTRYAIERPAAKDMLYRPPFFHATIMMRKSAYDAVNGYYVAKRTERSEDYDLWFRFFAKGLAGYNLQEGLYHVLEDDRALKRRTIQSRVREAQTMLVGYRLLRYPWYLYPCALKPIAAALVPIGLMQRFHIVTDGSAPRGRSRGKEAAQCADNTRASERRSTQSGPEGK